MKPASLVFYLLKYDIYNVYVYKSINVKKRPIIYEEGKKSARYTNEY